MSTATLWWIAAIVLAGAELLTGTLYLLVIATGAVAAAIAAHLGLGLGAQIILAAVVGIVNVVAWHIWRTKKRPSHPADFAHNATRNRLDIGGVVVVQTWQDDGSTHVPYRGAMWSAVALDPSAQLQPGRHVVVDIRRNQLVLRPEQ